MESKIYYWARKIHRLLVLFMSLLGLLMGVSGTMLKFQIGPNLDLARYVHNQLSTLLFAGLLVMIVTGLLMYLFPLLLKSKYANKSQS